MTALEEKITTEPGEAQEEGGETQENELIADDPPPPDPEPPAPEAPAPKKKAAAKKTPKLLEIPVDPPVLERATSSTTPAPKPRGRPKGSVGVAKRAQAAEPTQAAAPPPTPREPEQLSPEDHVTLLLRHSRQMQEARRVAVRDKYRSWVA